MDTRSDEARSTGIMETPPKHLSRNKVNLLDVTTHHLILRECAHSREEQFAFFQNLASLGALIAQGTLDPSTGLGPDQYFKAQEEGKAKPETSKSRERYLEEAEFEWETVTPDNEVTQEEIDYETQLAFEAERMFLEHERRERSLRWIPSEDDSYAKESPGSGIDESSETAPTTPPSKSSTQGDRRMYRKGSYRGRGAGRGRYGSRRGGSYNSRYSNAPTYSGRGRGRGHAGTPTRFEIPRDEDLNLAPPGSRSRSYASRDETVDDYWDKEFRNSERGMEEEHEDDGEEGWKDVEESALPDFDSNADGYLPSASWEIEDKEREQPRRPPSRPPARSPRRSPRRSHSRSPRRPPWRASPPERFYRRRGKPGHRAFGASRAPYRAYSQALSSGGGGNEPRGERSRPRSGNVFRGRGRGRRDRD
ncbi:hypothetical protein ABW19_dt0202561 [Dactylella cylindrospora]|nr:hypothetical protein ABW19_dt0202561 [Dactylella cylindrospora]